MGKCKGLSVCLALVIGCDGNILFTYSQCSAHIADVIVARYIGGTILYRYTAQADRVGALVCCGGCACTGCIIGCYCIAVL